MLPQESDNIHVLVVCGDTHRQVLQPLRVGLLLTTRFLFAGTSFSSITACFPIFAAMLEGQYRGHGIDGSSEEIRHVVTSYNWFVSLDALPLFVPSPSAEMDLHQPQLMRLSPSQQQEIMSKRGKVHAHSPRGFCYYETASSSYA